MKYLPLVLFFVLQQATHAQISLAGLSKETTIDIDDLEKMPAKESWCEDKKGSVSHTDQWFSGGCLGTLVRQYTFVCGAETQNFEQYIAVTDHSAPVFTWLPADMVLPQGSELPPVEAPHWADNSKREVFISMKEENTGDAIYRIWTATDLCGNQSTHRQVIAFESN